MRHAASDAILSARRIVLRGPTDTHVGLRSHSWTFDEDFLSVVTPDKNTKDRLRVSRCKEPGPAVTYR